MRRILENIIPIFLLIQLERIARNIRNLKSFLIRDDRYYESTHRKEFFWKAFKALSYNGITGDYAEFGCHKGSTFSMAYHASRRINYRCNMWAFDSFLGLPPKAVPEDEHPAWIEGSMSTTVDRFKLICRINRIRESDYKMVVGYYEDTIGIATAADPNLPNNIALAYLDCDLYSSTKTVLRFLSERLKHGMIIAFDDYYCWSNIAIAGNRKACLEFLSEDNRYNFLPFCQFGWHGMAFVVEDRKLY